MNSGNLNFLEPSGSLQACNGTALPFNVGRDRIVGVATRYGLNDPEIESRLRGGSRFSTPVLTSSGAHPASYTMDTGSFLGGKAAGTTHPLLTPRLKKE